MDRRQTEWQLNNTNLCNIKNSYVKVIVNGTLNMLSRSYTLMSILYVEVEHSL